MTRKEYSAGAVSTSFWFMEFKKEVELLVSGRTFEEIRSLCRTENIFAASTPYRARWTEQTFGRLGRIYKTFLYEAGVTDKGKDVRLIYKPLLDTPMERWMDENGMEQIKKALSGVR